MQRNFKRCMGLKRLGGRSLVDDRRVETEYRLVAGLKIGPTAEFTLTGWCPRSIVQLFLVSSEGPFSGPTLFDRQQMN